MKKFLPFLIMFFVLTTLFAQQDDLEKDQFNYKVIYDLTYQPDSTNVESRKSEQMVLYIGDGFSRFSSAGQAIGDSLQSAFDYSNFNQAAFKKMRSQIPNTEFQYYLYKGIPSGKMTYTREIIDDGYRYSAEKNNLDWNILEATDTIAGLRVQKATINFAGRKYSAWFTEEIPIPEGPYKFSGLPGLIVKIGDEKEHYVFELIEIRKLENPVNFVFELDEYLETNQKKLTELEREFERDPVGYMQRSIPDATIKVEYQSEAHKNKRERERKEKLRRQNNPIELDNAH